MLKNVKLTYQFFVLYSFLSLLLLLLCGYALFVIHDYEETLLTVDREYLPLARTVSEVARHQVDQTLRFNEILLYARINDREKFEVSNERFVQAGKRVGDEILEGRNTAQRGIDAAQSESKLKALDAIKTLLKGIEKTHGDYEHLGALLIRAVYRYDFLLKNKYLKSGDHIAGEEEAIKHAAFLKTTLSALEDETRRLEGGIKESMERVKQLSRTLAADATQQKKRAFNRIGPLLFFALAGGLLLVMVIARAYNTRVSGKERLIGQAVSHFSGLLIYFKQALQAIGPSAQRLEQGLAQQNTAVGGAADDVQALLQLAENALQLFPQFQILTNEKRNALDKTDRLVKQLNTDASDMLQMGIETKRIIQTLKDRIVHINMLATNASAEAVRSEATRSFSVFTQEIMDVSRSTASLTETLAHRIDDAIKGIHADHTHVEQTHRSFSDVIDLARKEENVLSSTVMTTQKQSDLLKNIRGVVFAAHANVRDGVALLGPLRSAVDTAQTRTDAAQVALEQLLVRCASTMTTVKGLSDLPPSERQ